MTSINRSSEHAIRAMTYLAQRAGGEFTLARRMAEELKIPAPFLGKCLQPLVTRGLLESQRGRNGGFRLVAAPADVTLYQIVDVLEHLGRPRLCFLGQAECSDERACPMHDYWYRASNEYTQRLSTTTLADLLAFCDDNPSSGYPAPRPDQPNCD